MDKMVAMGIPCDAVGFNSLIDACAKAGSLTKAKDALRRMSEVTNVVI